MESPQNSETPETQETAQRAVTPGSDRVDLATGTAGSLLVNLGYLILVHGDQRMLLLLFATVLLGMGLLLSESKGALGMGMLFGAAGAIATALVLVAVNDGIR